MPKLEQSNQTYGAEISADQKLGHEFSSHKNRNNDRRTAAVAILLSAMALALTVFAYSPILFSWVSGDDLADINWLRQCPNLIIGPAQSFIQPFMNDHISLFYRPICGIFLALDYALWKDKYVGFHITNLTLHVLNSVLTSLICFRLLRNVTPALNKRLSTFTAVSAGAIFALYPIHPEAVSWMSGRVDVVPTFFFLVALQQYLKWRITSQSYAFYAALISSMLAFGSKECALVFPAVIVAYEVLIKRTGKSPLSTMRPVLAFWGMLIPYFLVRRLALGTFIGGYRESSLSHDLWPIIQNICLSLHTLVYPIHPQTINTASFSCHTWDFLVPILATFLITGFIFNRSLRPIMWFTIAWFAVQLVPVFRIFCILPTMESARYAYLPSVPFCMLLSFTIPAIAQLGARLHSKLAFVGAIPVLVLALASTNILFWNNEPWRKVGLEARYIQSAFANLKVPTDSDSHKASIVVYGLPDSLNGAFLARNAVYGLHNFDDRDVVCPDLVEPEKPVARVRASQAPTGTSFRWDILHHCLIPIQPFNSLAQTEYRASQLHKILHCAPAFGKYTDEGIRLDSNEMSTIELLIDVPWECAQINVHMIDAVPLKSGRNIFADLHFTPSVGPDMYTETQAIPTLDGQTLKFEVSRISEWSLSDQLTKIHFVFAPGTHATIDRVEFIPIRKIGSAQSPTNASINKVEHKNACDK